MHLLTRQTLKLTDFSTEERPRYTILSHCWLHGLNKIPHENVELKQVAKKVLNACKLASELVYNSSEFSEAISSMYSWSGQAGVCLAFFDDVDFTRGWTLQESIVPDNFLFCDKDWDFIGDQFSLANNLSNLLPHNSTCICGLDDIYEDKLREIPDNFTIAMITSWATRRKTSREEDTAYRPSKNLLMGSFDINMPPLYGEKRKAFRRLQEEMIKQTNDQSIIAWADPCNESSET
ncbi:heterokaryon incompatibility protein-domain-containing protein [Xylaria acuta]|nr:heterokaryon incompatibility protein-domain-containing protein [Xylaria acuta]